MADRKKVRALPLPPDVSKPLFSYGSLKPGELAHEQIEQYVSSADRDAYIHDYILRTRDGLPLLIEGHGRVPGTVLWFVNERDAYTAVCEYEPRKLYKWGLVTVHGQVDVAANVLLPKRPERGTDDHELDRGWTSALDPVLGHGLSTVARLAEEANREPWPSLGERWEFSEPFFRMQAAFLLAWSVAERYSALTFGPALDPGERIRKLETRASFKEALDKAHLRTGRRVVDSRDPSNRIEIDSDGRGAWDYWYQVRSNMSHRGKGANRDAEIVREALVDIHDVLRLMLRRDVPDIEYQWAEADPDGARYDWLLRGRLM
jgi:gamma-glutamylcyclotransferase (GGCT)/AIG2-like uncharacterized protein YtfP